MMPITAGGLALKAVSSFKRKSFLTLPTPSTPTKKVPSPYNYNQPRLYSSLSRSCSFYAHFSSFNLYNCSRISMV